MGIRNKYAKWTLSRYLQITFITAGLLISAIMIIITRLQLDWLRSYMTDHSKSMFEDNTLSHMQLLAEEEKKYLTIEFSNGIKLVEVLREMDRAALGYSDISYMPLKTGTAHNSQDVVEKSYNYSFYYSKYYPDMSEAGFNLVNLLSAIDQLLPILNDPDYLYIYGGYYTDEILYLYPAETFRSTDYTPIVREWFYKATDDPDHVIITEPYIDASSLNLVFSITAAIKNTSDAVIGVAAVDVTLATLTKKIKSISILETGFSILITERGVVLTVPDSWNTDGTLRIYNQTVTNIDEDQWGVIKALDDGSNFDYTNVNGTDYMVVIEKIRPFENNDTVTHYVLLFANKSELQTPIDDLNNSFNEMYVIAFWFVLSVSVIVFIATIVLIYFFSEYLIKKLKLVEKIFSKVVKRALFPKIYKGVRFHKVDKNKSGIEKLVEACKTKISAIKEEEEKFFYFNWEITRPSEYNLHSNWNNKIYPFNKYSDKKMAWKDVLPLLDKVLTAK